MSPLVSRVESNLPFPQVSFKDRWIRLSTGKFNLHSCSISMGGLIPEMFWKAFRNTFICFVIVCQLTKAVLDPRDFRHKHCFAKLWNRPFGLGPAYF